MVEHKCYVSDDDVGFNFDTNEKDYFCPVCQRKLMTVRVEYGDE